MNEIHTVSLELGYKGSRNYLHGTDMYNAIMGHMSLVAPQYLHDRVKIVIHDFICKQCDMIYSLGEEGCPRSEKACVEFSLSGNVSGWLRETERLVITRRPYPEDEIVAKSRIDGRTIYLDSNTANSFSPIEILVALTKRLHLVLQSSSSRWAFTRLDLKRPLEDSDSDGLRVELLQSLGNRLTKSSVQIGNVPLGYIFFSAIES